MGLEAWGLAAAGEVAGAAAAGAGVVVGKAEAAEAVATAGC